MAANQEKTPVNHQSLSSFIWSVADLLRGDYKQADYAKVILPLTVLRRLDCVLASTKDAVLAEFDMRKGQRMNPVPFLLRNMAKAREVDLWPAEHSDTLDANFYCGILVNFDLEGSRFTMKPDAIIGFAALGISARPKKPVGDA